jgi:hypothetical protein
MQLYYEKTVARLVHLMTERLLNFYKPPTDESSFHELRWVKQLRKAVKALNFMEKAKKS